MDYYGIIRTKGVPTNNEIATLRIMALRSCEVTYHDPGGIEHTVAVTAQTLYEAIAQALRIFREQAWCNQYLRRSAASVIVKIAEPQVEHRVKISALRAIRRCLFKFYQILYQKSGWRFIRASSRLRPIVSLLIIFRETNSNLTASSTIQSADLRVFRRIAKNPR